MYHIDMHLASLIHGAGSSSFRLTCTTKAFVHLAGISKKMFSPTASLNSPKELKGQSDVGGVNINDDSIRVICRVRSVTGVEQRKSVSCSADQVKI